MAYFESTSKILFLLIVFAHYGKSKVYQRNSHWGTWRNKLTCESGLKVCGIQVRIQAWQWVWDDTAVNGIRAFCCRPGGMVMSTKQFSGIWGYWAIPQKCARGYAVSGIRVKMEPSQLGDDTALCGIRIQCSAENYHSFYSNRWTLSTSHAWGNWLDWQYFQRKQWMVGYTVSFHNSCGSCDDTALNGLRIYTTK